MAQRPTTLRAVAAASATVAERDRGAPGLGRRGLFARGAAPSECDDRVSIHEAPIASMRPATTIALTVAPE